MKKLAGFTKKEFMEAVRTGKLLLLLLLFSIFGIMAPAFAKLMPLLMGLMSEQISETGIMITEIKVDAMTSWTQFYKNIPIAFLIFFLMFSGIITTEYQKGTLIPIVTKGLERWKIITAKLFLLLVLWTVGYWLCYGITYFYNIYFWDNGIISSVFFTAFCFYLLGIWLISLLLLLSVFFRSNSMVMIGVLGIFLIVYLLDLLLNSLAGDSFFKQCLPVKLLDSAALLTGTAKPEEYIPAVFIAIVCSVFHSLVAAIYFSRMKI